MTTQPRPLHRSIAAFLAGYEDTVQQGRSLTLRTNPTIGIDVYVGSRRLATVALLQDETREDLQASLPRLYRQDASK
jgi:hypothetical protein